MIATGFRIVLPVSVVSYLHAVVVVSETIHATALNTHSTPDTTVFKISQSERYLHVGYRPNKGNVSTPAINISGKWLQEAGFSTRQPLKLRVMPGCLVITAQDIRELWFMLPGLSRAPFDERAAAEWLGAFPAGCGSCQRS
ncbi:type I toxin-antitoxin system SymE family toxin [Affinibrenneria salicis]|uniref:Type I toxin-antitoxin system SymE family toxin n=1 Tax=Affinibrenneria salicis TaxID=2590031 RepID=A0A5J5FQZ3_9GAMM|nr:SymE family type I addiction module toxin [Affinibrenneria salicis]KAA8993529.1 type I toxin-antitoxin system SymE family toxin [Affinibrenneria salicis]